jgi:RNA polymerase sigma factor (sigma-70 family)
MSDGAPKPMRAPDKATAADKREISGALTDLYHKHWAELVRFVARTFGPGPPEPEDAAQAAFEHYAALAKPEEVDNARAFLYRSARNFVLDQKRRMKVRARYAASADAEEIASAQDDLDAERVLAARDRLRLLEVAIRNMDPHLREVFILHRIHELSYAEISRRKRISQTQAKKLVAKSLLICERAINDAEGRVRS